MTASKPLSEKITGCRACSDSNLVTFLDLGITPLADRLLMEDELETAEEIMVPLETVFCPSCGLVQITETVDPEVLFCRNYPYFSSVSPSLMAHFQASAEALVEKRGLGPDSLVIEAASNDGYMLRHFVKAGVPVLGIDPADGPAKKAQESGVNTMNTFFTLELAKKLAAEGKQADVFLANNVLAHVADLNGFVGGIATLLKESGIAVIECPYLLDLIEHREFDTIYHQHLCYFSISALVKLFASHGLNLCDVQQVAVHGGTVRLFIDKGDGRSDKVKEMLAHEEKIGATTAAFYEAFGQRVAELKSTLMKTLADLKAQGKRIIAYGAPAKGCTLMAYCGIDKSHLDYVVDLNPVKHGRYYDGNRLKIEPVQKMLDDQPDYALILPWNFAEEIMKQQSEWAKRGGHFIIPIPEVKVV